MSSNVDSFFTNKGSVADSSFVKATPMPSPRSSIRRARASSHRLSSTTLRDTFRSRSNSIEALILEVRNAFDPNSKFIQFWHQILLACLLYEVMAMPFLLTFKISAEKWLTSELMAVYACEVLFVVDVYVELNTGYYEDGNVFRDAKKSRLKYIKSDRFALDMIALPPISLFAGKSSFSPVYLELHKLIRICRIPKYISMLDDVYAKNFVLLKMFKVLVVTVLLSHFVACVRFKFGFDTHGDNHWLPHAPTHELSPKSKYLMSLFWAFGILTGLFEGELPYTIKEFVFTIIVALCGISLFIYLCATFFMISKCESGHTETAEARINQFKHLSSFHHVPNQLQQQAIGYLKRYYTYTESNDRETMRLLCPSISKDIQVAMLKDMVSNIIFQDCAEQFIIAITSLLEMISLPANFTLFHANDLGDAMYLVNSGVLHVIVDGVELTRFHMERVLEGYPEYATSIPDKVEEMAKSLFGHRVRADVNLKNGNESKTETKKTIAGLLRKHMKVKEKARVAPSLESVTATAFAISKAGQRNRVAKIQPDRTEETKSPSLLSLAEHASPLAKDIDQAEKRANQPMVSEHFTPPPFDKKASATARVTHAIQELYVQVGRSSLQFKQPFRRYGFLLRRAIDVESKMRMWWVLVLQINLMYNWIMVPLHLVFDLLDQSSWYLEVCNALADIVLWVDLYLNFNFTYFQDSEKIWDTSRTAQRYMKSWFTLDLLSVLPYNAVVNSTHHATVRIPRLLRIVRLPTHFREVDNYLQLKSKQRLLLFGIMLCMMYHVIACLHFSITYIEGFSPKHDAWIPADDVYLVRLNQTHFIDIKIATYPVGSSKLTKRWGGQSSQQVIGSDMYFVFTGVLDTLIPRDEFLRGTTTIGTSTSPNLDTFGSGNLPQPNLYTTPPTSGVGMPAQPLTKLNQIGAGSYFGENALFFSSARSAYVRAKASCILYKLSRDSLDLVFNRYPNWKQKVLRMMKVRQEQQRLNCIAFEEQQNVATGTRMAQEDHLNAEAERAEEEVLVSRRMQSNTMVKRKPSRDSRFMNAAASQASGGNKQSESPCKVPKVLSVLFYGAPAQIWYHFAWLKLIAFTTIYMSIVVPYRITFDVTERTGWIPAVVRESELLCELLFVADIWVSWRIKNTKDSMDLYEQDHRQEYLKERLVWDILGAFPVDYLALSFTQNPWCRINRCFKLLNFTHYMNELNRRSIFNEMHRRHWLYESYGDEWQAWLPDKRLDITSSASGPATKLLTLRLLRGLFFATTAFVKKGRTFIPDSTHHLVFAIITRFVGLLVMAFMIGEIASLFISYIGNEVEYRKNHIALELYLGRWKISRDLRTRTQAFLSSLWSSHRGVDYQSLLEEVPSSIRTESVLNIASFPLRAFVDDVFCPISRNDHSGSPEALMQLIARHLRFEGYPRGENVLVEGSISKSMYFVVRGQLHSISHGQPNIYRSMNFSKGDYFGEKGVLGYSVSAYSVRTLRACDLLSLSSEALVTVLQSHPIYSIALTFADQAVQHIALRSDPARSKDTETRWGRKVLEVIQQNRDECLLKNSDSGVAYANNKLLVITDALFALKSPSEAFGAFRPLLELVVPNGALATYGITKMVVSFSRVGSVNRSSDPPTTESDQQKVFLAAAAVAPKGAQSAHNDDRTGVNTKNPNASASVEAQGSVLQHTSEDTKTGDVSEQQSGSTANSDNEQRRLAQTSTAASSLTSQPAASASTTCHPVISPTKRRQSGNSSSTTDSFHDKSRSDSKDSLAEDPLSSTALPGPRLVKLGAYASSSDSFRGLTPSPTPPDDSVPLDLR